MLGQRLSTRQAERELTAASGLYPCCRRHMDLLCKVIPSSRYRKSKSSAAGAPLGPERVLTHKAPDITHYPAWKRTLPFSVVCLGGLAQFWYTFPW
ncbi:uncharacterized protein BDW43DRAFT_263525 [Aspergillus alliaceus]|uniref:uncharacterized protein n=1 Tax=Petromyces alliaceus TaxID=209559 RepID=UPI0012A5B67C|nr:uncharacterized protein BDW43DRAFT_263525 [Aspergillus alliaceus]KAB8237510.1 hypothetical protein BDW43DRAFT_263525 [Aspergillus alliaceus]